MNKPDITSLFRDADLGGDSLFTVLRSRIRMVAGDATLTTTRFRAIGIIQPVGFSSATMEPGQDTTQEMIRIYTETLLRIGDTTGNAADEILYQNRRWKVTEVHDWVDWGYCVAKAILMKETETEDA